MLLKKIARPITILTSSFALVGMCFVGGSTVQAGSGVIPIEIDPDSVMVAGSSAKIQVTMNSAPANIRIYTQPSGTLAYQGTVNSAVTSLTLPVNINAPAGTTIVTVSSGGRTASSIATIVRSR
jgi:hypothetical protein